MELLQLPQAFTVCKVPDDSQINLTQDYCFVGKTAEEFSLVCPTERVPAATTAREDGWRALKVQGILDFFPCRDPVGDRLRFGGTEYPPSSPFQRIIPAIS